MKFRGRNKYLWELLLLSAALAIFVGAFLLNSSYLKNTSLDAQTRLFEKEIRARVKAFDQLLSQAGLMDRLTQSKETLKDLASIPDSRFYFYLYKNDQDKSFLRFWNTGIVVPSDELLYSDQNEQGIKLANGYYYSIRRPVPGHPDFMAICLILMKSSFFVETDYLRDSYPFDQAMDQVMDIGVAPTQHAIRGLGGQPVFYLKKKPDIKFARKMDGAAGTGVRTEIQEVKPARDSALSVVLKITGLFLIFLSCYLLLAKRFAASSYRLQIWLLLACLLAFRIGVYIMSNAWNFSEFKLFDPDLYGSGFLLSTFGDLLINSLLFCWICVFVWNRLSVRPFFTEKYTSKTLRISGASFLVILIAATFSIADVIKDIIGKSKISFDVTNIDSLSVFTIVGFLVLACLCLGFYYLSRTLYKYIFAIFRAHVWQVYLWTAVLGLMFITLFVSSRNVTFCLPVLLWLLVYTFIFTKEEVISRFVKFSVSGTVLWIFIFSISLCLLMLNEITKAELSLRTLYCQKLATQTDPASERLISIANKYMDSNYFRNNFHRLYDEEQNAYLRDSMRQRNYIGYLNNYVTNLYIFDSLDNPLYNQFPQTVASLNTTIANRSRPTSLPDMYFYESEEFDNFAYITRRIIKDAETGRLMGSIYIVSNPRRFAVANIKPELFKQFKQGELSNSAVYQFAIYHNYQLTSSSASKKYPFTTTLTKNQFPKKKVDVRERGGYSEVWYRAGASKVIIMVRKSEMFLEATTLFSYIFCAFLFLVALINVLMIVLGAFMNKRLLRNSTFFPTIRSQIHGTFILINVLAFVVVGAATISFFVNRFEESNNDRLGRTMNIMLNEINFHDSLRVTLESGHFNEDLFQASAFNAVVKRVSDIHGLDVNVYDFTGELRATSQADVYSRGVLSTRMSPRAFYSLLRLRRAQYIQKEQVSKLSYNTIYAPVGANSAAPYAYLSIPYFTSQQELNQEISNFLITLINLYAFIFLLTGLLALLITNRITGSFTVISNKMKEVSLSRVNEEIVWERNDEIGQLVREYNKMVSQLQESADRLARSEREEAWREMARQVAHEIKNPLTPMKLSLQYLQKAIAEKSSNVQQLTSSVAKTLVEQIDYLSKIAADFSQFANINHVKEMVFDLHEVLQPLESIYSKNPDVTFHWKMLPGSVTIKADKTQMNRLFTNLLVNAIDACDKNTQGVISVRETLENSAVTVSITDNGTGISDEMRNKIFTPNFTTKSSGTGLGLAMCKSIVEKANGTIWFETELGVGTTFYVRLPLLISDNPSNYMKSMGT
ncbi:sensor histidine kinase [Niabella drilacis]|uniref:histidine kinase n=1 Tax=Niabella drilacis (strain DSM 25811 / CCM 8410 / CCUG 62505 / LMG 26954 / E90) TaxID=1285928 RepID=A0A1G6ZRH5_NIADE|nr:HAMP domain-containing sensor histidine kinase [Niabella drilacis]SDE04445.1 His Kinase A (phospho-acceptor) domain-containing protein [Niabella drilacis]